MVHGGRQALPSFTTVDDRAHHTTTITTNDSVLLSSSSSNVTLQQKNAVNPSLQPDLASSTTTSPTTCLCSSSTTLTPSPPAHCTHCAHSCSSHAADDRTPVSHAPHAAHAEDVRPATSRLPRVPLGQVVTCLVDKWSREYLDAARDGDVESMCMVAQMYIDPQGWGAIQPDEAEGRRWLQCARNAGHDAEVRILEEKMYAQRQGPVGCGASQAAEAATDASTGIYSTSLLHENANSIIPSAGATPTASVAVPSSVESNDTTSRFSGATSLDSPKDALALRPNGLARLSSFVAAQWSGYWSGASSKESSRSTSPISVTVGTSTEPSTPVRPRHVNVPAVAAGVVPLPLAPTNSIPAITSRSPYLVVASPHPVVSSLSTSSSLSSLSSLVQLLTGSAAASGVPLPPPTTTAATARFSSTPSSPRMIPPHRLSWPSALNSADADPDGTSSLSSSSSSTAAAAVAVAASLALTGTLSTSSSSSSLSLSQPHSASALASTSATAIAAPSSRLMMVVPPLVRAASCGHNLHGSAESSAAIPAMSSATTTARSSRA